MNARTLKIEATGDFFRGKIKPHIRLKGYWLEQAGFKPGHRVQVLCSEAGTLSVHFIESPPAVRRTSRNECPVKSIGGVFTKPPLYETANSPAFSMVRYECDTRS
jgi:hypothetical protein